MVIRAMVTIVMNNSCKLKFGNFACVQVWWLDPIVQGYDGSEISRLQVTHQPGSLFSVGTTKVVYTATDVYGVKGQCSFNVTVMEQGKDNKCRQESLYHTLA